MADKEKKVSNKPTKGEEKTGKVSRRRFLKSSGLIVGGAAAGICIGNNLMAHEIDSNQKKGEMPIKDGYGGTVLRVDLTSGEITWSRQRTMKLGNISVPGV